MADPATTGLAAAATSALAALLAWFGNRKGKQVDMLGQVLGEVRQWNTELRESEERCQAELDRVRRESRESIDVLNRQIDELRALHRREVAELRQQLDDLGGE